MGVALPTAGLGTKCRIALIAHARTFSTWLGLWLLSMVIHNKTTARTTIMTVVRTVVRTLI